MNEKTQTAIVVVLMIFVLYYVSKFLKGVEKGVTAVTDVAGNVTDNFGITAPQEAKDIKKLKAFQPTFYKTLGSNPKLLTMKSATELSKLIYDAKTSFFYNDDNETLSVFRKLSTQSQVSFLCETFNNKYGRDCLNFFFPLMENRYVIQLYHYVSNLPVK